VELGATAEEDRFYCLNYDGEYTELPQFAVVAGSAAAENEMTRLVRETLPSISTREGGLRLALEAWALGKAHARRPVTADEGDEPVPDAAAILREELAHGTIEAALLERQTHRESKFRLLRAEELEPLARDYR